MNLILHYPADRPSVYMPLVRQFHGPALLPTREGDRVAFDVPPSTIVEITPYCYVSRQYTSTRFAYTDTQGTLILLPSRRAAAHHKEHAP